MNQRRLSGLDGGTIVAVLLLASCASARAQDVVTLQSDVEHAAETRILRLLDTSVTLDFHERPLAEVVQYLADSTGLPMRIDSKALENASIGADTPIDCELPTMTLRSALRLLLARLELTYVIKNEVLLVTTPEKACNELITRVYPVHDLVVWRNGDRTGENYQQLIDLITATIAPVTWDEVGGPGAIHEFRGAGAIVVSQTREVHDQIAPLLDGVRRARDLQHLTFVPLGPARSTRPGSRPVPAEPVEPPRYVINPNAAWLIPRVHD